MKTLQTKNLTKAKANDLRIEITNHLISSDLNYTEIFNQKTKSISIVAVKSCDAVASQFSNFEILFKNGARYAEIVISYE